MLRPDARYAAAVAAAAAGRRGGQRSTARAAAGAAGSTVLTAAQRQRAVVPAFWRARAVRLEAEAAGRCYCRDPQAGLLAEELLSREEREALEARPDAEEATLVAGVRAAFMDRFVLDAMGRRVRQVVLLGSGMDSRAFRLDVPPQLTFTEVDAGLIHELKAVLLEAAGQRARCGLRRVDLDLAAGPEASQELREALAPAVAAARGAGILFLLDGALEAWPAAAQAAALAAAAAVAPEGSTIVGPVPLEDALPALAAHGFARSHIVNHQQLQKIFQGAPVPQGAAMLVAMRGPAHERGGTTPGAGAARELQF